MCCSHVGWRVIYHIYSNDVHKPPNVADVRQFICIVLAMEGVFAIYLPKGDDDDNSDGE